MGECLADAGGAHAGFLVKEGRRDEKLIRKRSGELLKKLDVADSVAAEVKVAADAHPAGVKSFKQNIPHERLGRHGCEARVEGQDVNAFDAGLEDGVHLVVERRDARYLAASAEEVLRMRFKGDDGGNETARQRGFLDVFEKCLMTEMDAVEVADGNG